MALNAAASSLLKVGKGLSKDKKARKLALQHWLEAVSFIPYSAIYLRINVQNFLYGFLLLFLPINRLILDIAMATIFTFIMRNGSIVRVHSPSSIGKFNLGHHTKQLEMLLDHSQDCCSTYLIIIFSLLKMQA